MVVRLAVPVALVALALAAGAVAAPGLLVEPGVSESRRSGELGPGATPAELEAARREALALVNEARRRAGREPLERHAALERAASGHAADMLARGYFAHESPDGSTVTARAAAAGYRPALVLGETIAYGQRTAEDVVASWLASPPHRRILLDRRVTESGIGVAVGLRGRSAIITWVELVAAPAPAR